jgi:hypothetical protein
MREMGSADMARVDGHHQGAGESWSAIGRHDWGATETLETTLREVLNDFEGEDGPGELYQYVDAEALVDVISPETDRGASEVHFEYGDREIKISQDGIISIR